MPVLPLGVGAFMVLLFFTSMIGTRESWLGWEKGRDGVSGWRTHGHVSVTSIAEGLEKGQDSVWWPLP